MSTLPISSQSADHDRQERQLALIQAQVKKQPLTSELIPISELIESFSESDGKESHFFRGVKYLSANAGYTHIRKVRGDGNCYYRAFLYSVCETCFSGVVTSDNIQKLYDKIVTSLDIVCKYGYDKDALEMFHEELVDLFALVVETNDGKGIDTLHQRLNEKNGASEYSTWYLRVVTAAYLKSDPDRFMLFIDSHDNISNVSDISTFCAREVEPMGKECGMVQVTALAESLNIRVNIQYLDGRPFDEKLMMYEFGPEPDKAFFEITLLYRPGHYDILYKLESI